MKPTNPSATDIAALVDAKGELRLRVVPSAKLEKTAIENGMLKIWIRTAPEDGKANKAVIALLAKQLAIPTGNIKIIQGQSARDKRLGITLG
jgi:uncharacterized protein YggU (UPF0235/DUF167 family)